jgi:hypothetical protein
MYRKIIPVFLGILLIAPAFVQSQIEGLDARSKTIKAGIRPGKAFITEEPLLTTQAVKADKARVILMGTSIFVYFNAQDAWEMQHIVPAGQSDTMEIDVDFSAVLNTRVKFHVIFSGPEYYVYDDEDWYPAKYKTANYLEQNVFYIQIDPTEWVKGTYKLVVVAEQETLGSGAESVIECLFRII